MKGSSKLLSVLVALIISIFLTSVAVSNPTQGNVMMTLAIDVGYSAARLSVLVGANGLVFGDTGEPRIILTGPGTHFSSGPLEFNWTAEGFLLIKDGTDEAQYVHPSSTLFNLDHPVEFRSRNKHDYHNRPRITGYQAFTLLDITSKYLQKLITSAESIVRRRVTFTVILLPNGQNVRTTTKRTINHRLWGNFTSYQRVYVDGHDPQKTENAMRAAALPQRPDSSITLYKKASAAIFPFDNGMEYSRAFLVYRLGSSTFKVSVHKVEGGTSVIVSSVYNQHLGGNDFNQRIVDCLLLEHKTKTGEDLSGDDMFLLRLGIEVEKAKQVLSVQDWAQIEIESLYSGSQSFSEVLTRSQFENLNMDLFNKTITAIDLAIKNSFMYTKGDIQDIVFSGGSANIPFLQSAIKEHFGPHKKYHGLNNPETTVVLGAAKLGHWYQDTRHFTGGECCSPNAQTLTLGIETTGGAMFKYTDWNSVLTINKMYTFTTTKDYQDQVIIRVYGGDGKWTNQNRFLGKVRLTGIVPAPKGTPQIRVWLSTYGCGRYINLNVMDMASGRINATIISIVYYGKKLDDEIGAFELEPAGKLTLLH